MGDITGGIAGGRSPEGDHQRGFTWGNHLDPLSSNPAMGDQDVLRG